MLRKRDPGRQILFFASRCDHERQGRDHNGLGFLSLGLNNSEHSVPCVFIDCSFSAIRRLSLQVRGEASEDAPPSVPSKTKGPESVVEAQLQALRQGDFSTVFAFASPSNKAATGPLERFAQMIVYSPAFKVTYVFLVGNFLSLFEMLRFERHPLLNYFCVDPPLTSLHSSSLSMAVGDGGARPAHGPKDHAAECGPALSGCKTLLPGPGFDREQIRLLSLDAPHSARRPEPRGGVDGGGSAASGRRERVTV